MADTKITFTISEANIDRVTNAIKGLYRIPQVNTAAENETPVIENEFTDKQWAKEWLRRYIIKRVQKHEHRVAVQDVQLDDTLVS